MIRSPCEVPGNRQRRWAMSPDYLCRANEAVQSPENGQRVAVPAKPPCRSCPGRQRPTKRGQLGFEGESAYTPFPYRREPLTKPVELPQGTLEMLILKTVSLGPLHGYGILLRIPADRALNPLGATASPSYDVVFVRAFLRVAGVDRQHFFAPFRRDAAIPELARLYKNCTKQMRLY
jgi:hypothetical protein